MATFDGNAVERAGLAAIFARWQAAALEFGHQSKIRDEASKKADQAMTSITACREACKAFGVDPENSELVNLAFEACGPEAARMFNESRPDHLPYWHLPPPPAPDPQPDPDRLAAPSALETPPPPPLPRIRDVLLEYLELAHDLELGGTKAADMRGFIETKYATTIHEKTVGMTLYRLLKDEKVRRKGHLWFFVPQAAETKNPGVSAPGPSE